MSMSATSSTAPSPRPPRGGALDALRFAAALFVVVFHFGDAAPVPLQSFHPFLGRGYLATDFFLILSGFVLAKAYGAGVASGAVSLGRFWSKRFIRCYPTHIITLGLLVLMVAGGALLGFQPSEAHRFDWSGLPAQILLLHAFGLGGGHWNIPSWTISTLLICYAAFPTLWRLILRIGRPATALTLGLLILLVSDLLSMTLLHTEQFSLGFSWTFFRAAPLFLTGLTLARAIQTAHLTSVRARLLGFCGGALLLINAVIAGPDLINILAICVAIMGCGASPTTRALPFAAWGARVSFSLFMVHTLTGAIWFDAIQPIAASLYPALATIRWEAWVMWCGSLVATIVTAAIYCRFVDEPVVSWLNRRLFERRAAPRADVKSRPDRYPEPTPNG